MIKIIGGRKYNTETATELAHRWNGLSCTDFGYVSESLYKKKTGEFFIAGQGGARTRYAESHGNMWSDGENIFPITETQAREWAEQFCTVDEYETIFGEVEE